LLRSIGAFFSDVEAFFSDIGAFFSGVGAFFSDVGAFFSDVGAWSCDFQYRNHVIQDMTIKNLLSIIAFDITKGDCFTLSSRNMQFNRLFL
jgi:hypothetical protein